MIQIDQICPEAEKFLQIFLYFLIQLLREDIQNNNALKHK